MVSPSSMFRLAAFVFIVLSIIFPELAFAAVTELTPSNAEADEEATLHGVGFGNGNGEYDGLCFNTDKTCYLPSSDGLLSWKDSEIRFNVPGNIEPHGTLYVYTTASEVSCQQGVCRQYSKSVSAGTYSYQFQPTLLGVTDEGNIILERAATGQAVFIKGALFGSSGSIMFDDAAGKIISWNSDEVKVQVPAIEKVAYSVTVINSAGLSSHPQVFISFSSPSNDEYANLQLHTVLTNIPEAWKKAPKLGQGIVVAVIDSGINLNHPDLRDRIWLNKKEIANNLLDDDGNGYIDDYFGYNFVQDDGDTGINGTDHATMIAGIIAATKDNKEGIAGIAPQALIMPLVACDDLNCYGQHIISAIKYAADNGAHIINLSLGGFGTINDFTPVYNDAIVYAYEKGLVIVAAAGNGDYLSTMGSVAYGRYLNDFPNSPVCNDNDQNMVIGVASVSDIFKRSSFSDYGSNCIDAAAPGEAIVGLSHPALSNDGSDINQLYGTSFAAPQVSGAIALLLAEKPTINNWEIPYYLKGSGVSIDDKQSDSDKEHIGRLIDAASLLSYKPTNLPHPFLEKIEFDGKKLRLSGMFFNEGMSVKIRYRQKEKTQEFSTGRFLEKSLVVGDPKTIPSSEIDYKVYVTRVEAGQKSNELTLSKNFLSQKGFSTEPPSPEAPSTTQQSLFRDVSITHPHYRAISFLKERSILGGYPNGTFQPSRTVNRAELLKILVGGKGIQPALERYQNCFSDVKTEWFAPYVCYAKTAGWVQGYPDGYFRAEQPVNKVEAIKMLVHSQGYLLPASLSKLPFMDIALDDWFAPYVQVAYDKGILEETGTRFVPGNAMTREGISENLYRALFIAEKKIDSFSLDAK